MSSGGIQSAIDINNPKSVKLGAYNFLRYSNGKRAYKLMTNKTDQEEEFFLHYEPLGNKWAVRYFDLLDLTSSAIIQRLIVMTNNIFQYISSKDFGCNWEK